MFIEPRVSIYVTAPLHIDARLRKKPTYLCNGMRAPQNKCVNVCGSPKLYHRANNTAKYQSINITYSESLDGVPPPPRVNNNSVINSRILSIRDSSIRTSYIK